MRTQKISYTSPEEYLHHEAKSAFRHEYVAGEIYAMTGASIRHNLIALNVAASIRNHLKSSPCRVMMEGVKLHVARANAFYYPDVMVSCDPRLEKLSADDMVVSQPLVIVEVLSESTAGIDRREKMSAYRTLPGLKEYVLIEQAMCRVEVYRRVGDVGWEQVTLEAGEVLELPSLEFQLPLAEIYDGLGM